MMMGIEVLWLYTYYRAVFCLFTHTGLEKPVAVRMPNTRLDGFWDQSDSTPTPAYCPLLCTHTNPELPQLKAFTVLPFLLHIHKGVLGGDKTSSCDLILHQISFQLWAEHKSSFPWSLVQRAFELKVKAWYTHTLVYKVVHTSTWWICCPVIFAVFKKYKLFT